MKKIEPFNQLESSQHLEHLEPGRMQGYTSEFFDALYALGVRLYRGKEYEKAIAVAKEGMTLEPLSMRHYKLAAAIFQAQHDYHQALKHYAAAGQINATDPQIHYHAAQCFCYIKEYDKARSALKMAQYFARETGDGMIERDSTQLLLQIEDFA